jgi:hypothetical protein
MDCDGRHITLVGKILEGKTCSSLASKATDAQKKSQLEPASHLSHALETQI